jgi:spore coat protein U-like protein
MKKKVVILAILAAFVFFGTAMADTVTANLRVTAEVVGACNINSVTDVSFGTYNTTSATPTDATGDITLQCTTNTSYKTYIVGTRAMTGGSDTLNFDLYSDANRTVTFPIDNSGASANAPDNSPITENIYGRIPARQNVGVTNYSREMTITIAY